LCHLPNVTRYIQTKIGDFCASAIRIKDTKHTGLAEILVCGMNRFQISGELLANRGFYGFLQSFKTNAGIALWNSAVSTCIIDASMPYTYNT
jgi:hypothetical protein